MDTYTYTRMGGIGGHASRALISHLGAYWAGHIALLHLNTAQPASSCWQHTRAEMVWGWMEWSQARNDALGTELKAELALADEALSRVRDMYITVTDEVRTPRHTPLSGGSATLDQGWLKAKRPKVGSCESCGALSAYRRRLHPSTATLRQSQTLTEEVLCGGDCADFQRGRKHINRSSGRANSRAPLPSEHPTSPSLPQPSIFTQPHHPPSSPASLRSLLSAASPPPPQARARPRRDGCGAVQVRGGGGAPRAGEQQQQPQRRDHLAAHHQRAAPAALLRILPLPARRAAAAAG
jgi:hypothetical protein